MKRPISDVRRLILETLEHVREMSSYEICERAELQSGQFYVAMSELEMEGLVASRWEDMPKPRRRMYRIVLP
jgi:DNA-binding PadR family transcriptional regulator